MASRRSKARETALQMLYQQDLNPDMPDDTVRELIVERLEDEALARFAWSLFSGVMERRPALDDGIEAAARNWSLKRMAPTDRNVLRLGAFELLHTDTPPRVIIDECLELAKRYGTAQSPPFVNGILDRLIPGGGRQQEPLPAPPDAAADVVSEPVPENAPPAPSPPSVLPADSSADLSVE
ncbi:MAG: transcription antitermination factor NusB [Planctomycetes bacterium]|nr:transcription antitermination factor NusB [Planctomycetota bacterium]